RIFLQRLEVRLACNNVCTDTRLEGRIPLIKNIVNYLIFDQLGSNLKADCEAVHAGDMCIEQVFRLERLTANLSVKVDTTWSKSTILQYFKHRKSNSIQISREFVRIPTEQQVTLVGIDR